MRVSKNYKKVLSKFADYYKQVMDALGDKSLSEELEIIKLLQKSKEADPDQDDWEMKR